MCFINRNHGDGYMAELRLKPVVFQPFGSHIDEAGFAPDERIDSEVDFRRIKRAVDERCRYALPQKRVHLILHQ